MFTHERWFHVLTAERQSSASGCDSVKEFLCFLTGSFNHQVDQVLYSATFVTKLSLKCSVIEADVSFYS